MGTAGIMTDRVERLKISGSAMAKLCSTVERWVNSAPLGLPVVPEV